MLTTTSGILPKIKGSKAACKGCNIKPRAQGSSRCKDCSKAFALANKKK